MRRRQCGATLLEGLAAISIFSLGIISLSGLEAKLLAYGAQSQFRAQASYLSEEIIGLALADRANVACYTMSGGSPPSCANALAQSAAQDWRQRVQDTLPGALAVPPTVAYAADGTLTVTLIWQRTNESTQHNYASTTNLYPNF